MNIGTIGVALAGAIFAVYDKVAANNFDNGRPLHPGGLFYCPFLEEAMNDDDKICMNCQRRDFPHNRGAFRLLSWDSFDLT